MFSRRDLALGFGAVLAAAPGAVLAWTPTSPSTGDTASVDGRRDRSDRLSVPVFVGEAGPFGFVVDCGADRSVLAADLAAALGLPPGNDVMIHGVTGAEQMATVRAPLKVGDLALRGGDLPVIPRERLGADGLLGVDVLAGRRLVMDFQRGTLRIGRASSDEDPVAEGEETYVSARRRFGLLTIVDARAAGRNVNVFVDSGGGVTIANQAMAQAVRRQGAWLEPAPSMIQLTGVTAHVMRGEVRVLDRLKLGGMSFGDIPMAVADLHVFDRWGLADEPTILLGANVLRLFSRVELDYRNRRILFRADTAGETLLA